MASGLARPTTVTVFASAIVTTSSATSNLKGTTAQIPMGDAIDLYLNCTDQGASLGGTLDVALDISTDGGTTWFEGVRFARIAISTGQQCISFRPTGIGSVEAAAGNQVVTGSSAVFARNIVMPPDQRIRYRLNNTGSSSAPSSTATFAVFAVVQPTGTGRQ